MAINIPHSALLSFGLKQVIDTFLRIMAQIEQEISKGHPVHDDLISLKKYLEVLNSHEGQSVRELAKDLAEFNLNLARDREYFQIFLERKNNLDIREDKFLISTQDTTEIKKKIKGREFHLILDNLRSSFNVGSLFRTAEAFGVSHIHICGYTATPENSKTAKSALGADQWVDWSYHENVLECIDTLKEKGVNILAIETEENAIPIHRYRDIKFPSAIILGNERYGLATPVLDRADTLIKINLHGRKNSLNVGVCGAIIIAHLLAN